MAIRAFDRTFVHTMLERHGELRLHRRVAGVTELGLLFREKEFRRFRSMDGVAIGADDILLRMNAAPDVRAGQSLRVAAKTGVERFLGSEFGESDDGRLAALRFDVSLPGSMTAFAARVFGRFLAARDTFEMRIPEELIKDRGVTRLAGIAANVISAAGKSGQEESG
jgi:hypothetical protein